MAYLDKYRSQKEQSSLGWFDFLKIKRKEYLEKCGVELQKSIQSSKEKHLGTIKFIKLFENNKQITGDTFKDRVTLGKEQEAKKLLLKFNEF